jgi:eukaryotic-like serine/threonine-protein kinase
MEPQDTIFLKARDIADPAERAAYLTQSCGNDAALRQRVEAMVRDATGADEFFGPEGTVDGSAFITEGPGTIIGRFKLLQKIAEGGMGVVYMAEQREPVIRKVALKIIKLGMDTKQVVARFEAERQALALMDHPNIAKVLDGGATQSGRPYFVMELVPGLPITQFCDEANLSTRDRLELFLEVCSAIQHAHQKGIIHRDIKPSNILVTLHGDKPVPKVIDFGVAKATQGRLTEKTLFTQFQQFIGTPAYMSPEQASLSGLDIDTRSDIYALGVLLYELLTGRTPFDGNELLKAGLDEMRRTIREKQPLRPSNRISTLQGDDLNTAARQRHTDPPKLIHLVRGDLDWIVMKALEKDRARRYETANGLAMDIMRHINCEPVVARPPSRLYEFQKTVRRHKFGFAATAALITVLAVGVLVSGSETIRARRAEQEQARLRQQAETEAAKSQEVSEFLKDMLRGVGPSVALGRDTTMLREILDKTTERVNKELANQPEVEGELLNVTGWVYWSIREFKKADAAFRQALVVQRNVLGNNHPYVADSLFGLGQVLDDENRPEESEASYRESLKIRRKVFGNEHLTVADCLNNITGPLVAQGKLAEAETCGQEALAMKRKLLPNDDPGVAISLRDLGLVYRAEGKLAEAESLLREGLATFRKALGNADPEVAWTLRGLASVLSAEGKLPEAETAEREALAIQGKLYDHTSPVVAGSLNALIDVLQREGKQTEAESLIDDLLTQAAGNKSESARLLCARGEWRARAGRWNEAVLEFSEAAGMDSNDEESSANLVLVLLEVGRNEECRQRCHELLAQAATNKVGVLGAATLAKASLLLPVDGLDLERACELADFVGSGGRVGQFSSTTKALAEYRRGHFDSASAWAKDAISKSADDPSRLASGWFIQALACARLQQIELARTALAKGNELVTQTSTNSAQSSVTSWRYTIFAEVLGREAKALIEGQPPATSK